MTIIQYIVKVLEIEFLNVINNCTITFNSIVWYTGARCLYITINEYHARNAFENLVVKLCLFIADFPNRIQEYVD